MDDGSKKGPKRGQIWTHDGMNDEMGEKKGSNMDLSGTRFGPRESG